MRPVPLTLQPEWRHLPRLAPEFYQGFAAVLWTVTLEPRATGWLDAPVPCPLPRIAPARRRPRRLVLPRLCPHARSSASALAGAARARQPVQRHALSPQAAPARIHPALVPGWNTNSRNNPTTASCAKQIAPGRAGQVLFLHPRQSPAQRVGGASARLAVSGRGGAGLSILESTLRRFLAGLLEAIPTTPSTPARVAAEKLAWPGTSKVRRSGERRQYK